MAEPASKSRIIIIGGSGSASGVNCKRIENETGYKSINLGLFYGLRSEFTFNNIRMYIKNGDIVVMIPEYGSLDLNDYNAYEKKWGLAYDYSNIVNYNNPAELIRDVHELLQSKTVILYTRLVNLNIKNMFVNGYYFYDVYFDNSGDMNKVKSKIFRPYDKIDGYNRTLPALISNRGIEVLKRNNRLITSKGAKLVLFFPAFPRHEYLNNKIKIDDLYHILRTKTNVTVLGTPGDFAYDYELFADTTFHLTNKGAEHRTKMIIDKLIEANLITDQRRI
ncbi:MAG: hypothetical protein KA369_15710 [Spirochaetes bacterium]|nr:hypothetical protein [Spirochaetota bacterium]